MAHPGANATGLSSQTTELMAKRLQLLQQIAPRTRRVIMLVNPDSPLHAAVVEEAQKASRTLRVDISPVNARNPAELDAALRALQRRADTVFIVSSDVFFIANRDKIADAVREARLPTLVPNRDYWGEGVLMAYGSGLRELDHRAAVYIDKILERCQARQPAHRAGFGQARHRLACCARPGSQSPAGTSVPRRRGDPVSQRPLRLAVPGVDARARRGDPVTGCLERRLLIRRAVHNLSEARTRDTIRYPVDSGCLVDDPAPLRVHVGQRIVQRANHARVSPRAVFTSKAMRRLPRSINRSISAPAAVRQ